VIYFLAAVIIVSSFLLYVKKRLDDRADAATTYWCDMGSKYHELIDDPWMSSEKWKEWLPLFEDADRRYAETHPYIKGFYRYAEAVRREIDDLPCKEVGSL